MFFPSRQETSELPSIAKWTNLAVAALIYVCTNPSRTQYMSVITEPLLEDFQLSRTVYGQINFGATMVVAALSVGFGTIIDRLGSYRCAWLLTMLTALGTLLTAIANGPWMLFAAMTMARLFGQGILAVVSTGLLGKSFPSRAAPMAASTYLIFTTLLTAGFLQWTRFGLTELQWNWRFVWMVVAAVIGCSTLLALCCITEPKIPPPDRTSMATTTGEDLTVWQAVRHPLFIVFGLYCLFWGAAVKGMDVFMESLLKDRGFGKDLFFDQLLLGTLSLIGFKLFLGWLCHAWSMGKVLTIGMLLSAGLIGSVWMLQSPSDVYVWSIMRSLCWSIYVVVYFSIWAYAFGRRDLAQIQGAIHIVTLASSGLGPLLLGLARDQMGSYVPILNTLAVIILMLGIAMLFVKVPQSQLQTYEKMTE